MSIKENRGLGSGSGLSATARLPMIPKGSVASSSTSLRWLERVTPKTARDIKVNYMSGQQGLNQLMTAVANKEAVLAKLQDTMEDLRVEVEGQKRELIPVAAKAQIMRAKLTEIDKDLTEIMEKRGRMDCLLLRTQHEWIESLSKLQGISQYKGKQLQAMVLGTSFKQHSEMLRDAQTTKVGGVRSQVRKQVMGHRRDLGASQKELKQLDMLEKAFERARAMKRDPKREARIESLKVREIDIVSRRKAISMKKAAHSVGKECLTLLKAKGHELPSLDALLERLVENKKRYDTLAMSRDRLLDRRAGMDKTIEELSIQREKARYYQAADGELVTDGQEVAAVKALETDVQAKRAQKVGYKRQLDKVAGQLLSMGQWVGVLGRLCGVATPATPATHKQLIQTWLGGVCLRCGWIFGITLPENIGIYHPSSLKVVPISLNAS